LPERKRLRFLIQAGKTYGEYLKQINPGIKEFMKKRENYLMY